MKNQLLDLECSVDEEAKQIRAKQLELYELRSELLDLFSKLLGKRIKKNFSKYNLYQKYKIFENIIEKEVKTEEDKKICLLAISAYHIASGLLNLRARPLEQLNPALVFSSSITLSTHLEEANEAKVEPRTVIREEVELKKSLERAIKLVENEKKLKERYQNLKFIKPRKHDSKLFEKIGSSIAIMAEIVFFAFLFGKEYFNLQKTEAEIKKTEKICQYNIEKRKLIKEIKNLDGKIFYSNEFSNINVEPGEYRLYEIIEKISNINNIQEDQHLLDILNSISIKVKKGKRFIWPVEEARIGTRYGWVERNIFGSTERGFHWGIDLTSGNGSNEIRAIDKGIVIKVVENYVKNKGYGKYVVIEHEDGFSSLYAHLSKILVEERDTVKQGDIIGIMGETGRATDKHLHFEIREKNYPVNPKFLINNRLSNRFYNERIGKIDEICQNIEKLGSLKSF
ncbi:MAG: M23 family metallopeptidase [Candidatus Pacearchaeota archaeon]|nr:M23 family metallopeptidase [Candidatus Pacearchaeota archaeon]